MPRSGGGDAEIKIDSCMHIYTNSCLKPLSNPLKAVFKQLKPRLNHGIHMLFEHGFYLLILKTGRRLFTWRQTQMQGCPGISILSWFLLTSTSLHFSRNYVKKSEKQNGVNGCVECCQSDFFMSFQASSTWIFKESYKMHGGLVFKQLGTRKLLMHEKTYDLFIKKGKLSCSFSSISSIL